MGKIRPQSWSRYGRVTTLLQVTSLNRASAHLSTELGRDATDDELANHLELPSKDKLSFIRRCATGEKDDEAEQAEEQQREAASDGTAAARRDGGRRRRRCVSVSGLREVLHPRVAAPTAPGDKYVAAAATRATSSAPPPLVRRGGTTARARDARALRITYALCNCTICSIVATQAPSPSIP